VPWGLDARLRGHDVLLAPDLRNGHLAITRTHVLRVMASPSRQLLAWADQQMTGMPYVGPRGITEIPKIASTHRFVYCSYPLYEVCHTLICSNNDVHRSCISALSPLSI